MRRLLIALVAFILLATQAAAATVTFTLIRNVDGYGRFSVYAESSIGDNAGLAVYSIPLTGSVLSIDHKSPRATSAMDSSGFGPAGFTFGRSDDGELLVRGRQGLGPPSVQKIMYGFGQQASSFAAQGLTMTAGSIEQPVWGAPLLMATGTFSPFLGSVDFNRSSADLYAQILDWQSPHYFIPADVVLKVIGVSGDYNGDSLVTASDYNYWRSTYGTTGANLSADGNNDGVVNAADYVVWRHHAPAGAGSSTSAAIPEPSIIFLTIVALAAVAIFRRRPAA